MRLAVFSYKTCWPSAESPSGYATDGGFAFQMAALSELFDATEVAVPVAPRRSVAGEIPLRGHNLSVVPFAPPPGSGLRRKISLAPWLLRNGRTMWRTLAKVDAVHSPIPADIGSLGMLAAYALRKPLFVRYCGNWRVQRTAAERFWKRFMEWSAGGRNVMLATGGDGHPPSARNPRIRWIFSTTLCEQELSETGQVRKLLPTGAYRLITVCRQERGKGTDVLIESLPAIRAVFPETTVDVVGDGDAVPALRAAAESLGLSEQVRFHGKVNHESVMRLLSQAHLFCYPTASEGFPKAVLEALASGLPVITTPVSVLPALIGSESGVLLGEAGPEALARAVVDCLSDADRYRAMSESALQRAREYSLEKWRDTIGGMLREAWGPLHAGG
jgi:glycosyltransferase involved in cell wall biosynthesis